MKNPDDMAGGPVARISLHRPARVLSDGEEMDRLRGWLEQRRDEPGLNAQGQRMLAEFYVLKLKNLNR